VSIFSSSPQRLGPGPLQTYSTLTELTRNPSWTRLPYEKNWFLFSPSTSTTYIHYTLTPNSRTFAKLIGGGLSTKNLTSQQERSCLLDISEQEISQQPALANGTWHQATPALKLILCNRKDKNCIASNRNTIFFAGIHRKHTNQLGLPVRYERYFFVWSASPPFSVLGISAHPVLFANETMTGWNAQETWDDMLSTSKDYYPKSGNTDAKDTTSRPPDPSPGPISQARRMIPPEIAEGKNGPLPQYQSHWAKFTHTTTIAYAHHLDVDIQDKSVGYLDDGVIVSIGVEDQGQVFARVRAVKLLSGLRICPDFAESTS
jgi:hypothetical protein